MQRLLMAIGLTLICGLSAQAQDTRPRVIADSCPPPASADSIRGEAVVSLMFYVDTLGRAEPEGLVVLNTSYDRHAAEPAREMVLGCRFVPAMRAGRAVRAQIIAIVTWPNPAVTVSRP